MQHSRVTPILLLVFFLLFSGLIKGQQTIYDESVVVYKKEVNGGINIHFEGIGFFFTKSHQKTVTKHNRWNIEMVSMRHPKEKIRYHQSYDNSKGYFYGRKNALILLRPTFGRKNIISEKYRKDGVSFATHFAIGPSIGLLKPVYILYGTKLDGSPPGTYDSISTERFDINKHGSTNDIVGRASFFEGILETSAIVGLHTKFGIDFEYSPHQTGVKGLETGICLDVFPSPVDIMDFRVLKNKSFFLSFYINMYIGKKYNTLN